MSSDERTASAQTGRQLLAWYGVLGAPLAWAVELLAGYGTQEAACSRGSSSASFAGNADSAIGALTVVMLLVAVGGALAARAAGRALAEGEIEDPRGRVAFMARFGTIASLLFALAIVLSGIPIFWVESCRT
jgi:hypothetical protein